MNQNVFLHKAYYTALMHNNNAVRAALEKKLQIYKCHAISLKKGSDI